jgi:alpha-galactosidase
MKTKLLLMLVAVLAFHGLAAAVEIPGPHDLPDPDTAPPNATLPVKVFILSGQSNMVGIGYVNDPDPGSLETVTKTDGLFPHMLDGSENWTVRNDVWYEGVITATAKKWLTIGCGNGSNTIGPELQFGHIMGYYHDEPVIVLKSSQGNRSLGWDCLPPDSVSYVYNNINYAGYGDYGNWPVGEDPPTSGGWYAGKQYDDYFMNEADWSPSSDGTPVFNVTDVLDNFASEFPQWASQGFEIAGFGWWQGHKDQSEPYASRYELNMVNFIKEVRGYYENRYPSNISPDAPFVIATIGFNGWALSGAGLTVANAQLAVSGETGNYPEFEGNVKTVESRDYWKDVADSPGNQGHHYNNNAWTYMMVGDAMGRAMAEMLPSNVGTIVKVISPKYGEVVPPGDVDLRWVNMDPNAPATEVYVDVWFGTDPNKSDSSHYTKIIDATDLVDDANSITVGAYAIGRYYWQVDSYIDGPGRINEHSKIEGDVYMFTNDGSPSIIDMGDDMITWSDQVVQLNPNVVDDGSSPLTYRWSAAPDDGVEFSDPNIEAPTVTITKDLSLISIVNAGFEDPVLADGDYDWSLGNQGWGYFANDGYIGPWNLGAGDYGGIAPEGDNVGWASPFGVPGGFAQVLTDTLAANTTYTLTVEVGNTPGYDWSGYKVQLLAGGTPHDTTSTDYTGEVTGGTLIAQDDNTLTIADNTFETSTVTHTSGSEVSDPNVGQRLQIRLLAIGPDDYYEVDFDDVKLSSDPPPSPPSSNATTVTLTLAVNDETNTTPVTDTMTIDVYATACIASRFGLGGAEDNPGDLDADCDTDLQDFAAFAAAWLNVTGLDEPYEILP